MSTQNGILSSEDELAASGIQEPVRYEFEAFLSDDEAMPDAPPEATAPHESSQPPSPTLSDMLQASAAVNDDEASVSNDWLPDGSVNGAPESFRDSVTGSVTGRSATGSASVISSRNVRFVDIEVGLKWLPPKKRAAFEVVEVDMDEDELASGNGYHSPRRLRKRQKVSNMPCETVVLTCPILALSTLRWRMTLKAGIFELEDRVEDEMEIISSRSYIQ